MKEVPKTYRSVCEIPFQHPERPEAIFFLERNPVFWEVPITPIDLLTEKINEPVSSIIVKRKTQSDIVFYNHVGELLENLYPVVHDVFISGEDVGGYKKPLINQLQSMSTYIAMSSRRGTGKMMLLGRDFYDHISTTGIQLSRDVVSTIKEVWLLNDPMREVILCEDLKDDQGFLVYHDTMSFIDTAFMYWKHDKGIAAVLNADASTYGRQMRLVHDG